MPRSGRTGAAPRRGCVGRTASPVGWSRTEGTMSLNIATMLAEAAKLRPNHPAIIIDDVTLPYSAIDAFARRFGGALRALGVRAGQHVALMLPNVPQFTIAYFGAHYAACPAVPLNVLLTPDEIAYHLQDSEAQVLVAWEGFFEQARAGFARAGTCKHLLIVKQDRNDMTAPEGAKNFAALAMA